MFTPFFKGKGYVQSGEIALKNNHYHYHSYYEEYYWYDLSQYASFQIDRKALAKGDEVQFIIECLVDRFSVL